MSLLMLPFWSRYLAVILSVLLTVAFAALFAYWPRGWFLSSISLVVFAGLSLLRFCDLLQRNHAILRNCPIAVHLRFFSEKIRPDMRQYFFEGDKDGLPFSRGNRAIVYQRAKKTCDKRRFGIQYEVCRDSFE